jgi:predicted NBD/HSP70 family sugar kinase
LGRAGKAPLHPALRLLSDLVSHLGVAIANVVNLINPAKVVLGGPLAAIGEEIAEPLRYQVNKRAVPAASRGVAIELSRWGGVR